MVTTWRLMTPVMAIRPTFWLNEVFGRPPKIPATAVPKPSAKVAPWISLSVAWRPAPPWVIPDTSPTVSTAETKAIRQKPMIAAAENSKPYLNGCGKAKAAERAHEPAMSPKGSFPTPMQ